MVKSDTNNDRNQHCLKLHILQLELKWSSIRRGRERPRQREKENETDTHTERQRQTKKQGTDIQRVTNEGK